MQSPWPFIARIERQQGDQAGSSASCTSSATIQLRQLGDYEGEESPVEARGFEPRKCSRLKRASRALSFSICTSSRWQVSISVPRWDLDLG
jgi:hypothetical protein